MGTRGESRGFANDFIAFHDQLGSIRVFDHPFSAQQRHRAVGIIANREVVDERMGPVRGQLLATVPVDEFVEFNTQTWQFEGCSHRLLQ